MANGASTHGGSAKVHGAVGHEATKALQSAITKGSAAISAAHKLGNDTLKLVSTRVHGDHSLTKLASASAAGAGSKLVSALHGKGSDTISASHVKFSADTLAGGAKSAAIHADAVSAHKDLFVFKSEHAGSEHVIQSFKGGADKVVLSGYGKSELAAALSSQKVVAGNLTFKLSDKTSITIEGHDHKLSASDFIIK